MTKKIIILVVIIAIVVVIIRFSTPEDTWICDHGQWIAHGHPFSPMPTAKCP
jgi:hypothetical protein